MRLSAALLGLAAVVVATSSALAAGPFTVGSTLDGKQVLPLRLRWIARPHIATSKVKEVDFLIDGKLRWVERDAPYYYGGDDNGRNAGFLITTWLTPGTHRFTANVTATDGRRATDTVVARVVPAPVPPAKLAGTWTRRVTPADLKKSGSEPPPAGVWKLVFDRIGAWHLDPMGSGVVNEYEAEAGTVHVYAPIWMAPNGISKFGHTGLGGNDCTAAGPFGSYRWSVSGSKLTLTALHEGCGNRRAVWEGTWARAH